MAYGLNLTLSHFPDLQGDIWSEGKRMGTAMILLFLVSNFSLYNHSFSPLHRYDLIDYYLAQPGNCDFPFLFLLIPDCLVASNKTKCLVTMILEIG